MNEIDVELFRCNSGNRPCLVGYLRAHIDSRIWLWLTNLYGA